jgi:hypothetical protein
MPITNEGIRPVGDATSYPISRNEFSLRRAWIMALVVSLHGLLVLVLLLPAAPWKGRHGSWNRHGARGRGLVLVFLNVRASTSAPSAATAGPEQTHTIEHRAAPQRSSRKTARKVAPVTSNARPPKRSDTLVTTLPSTPGIYRFETGQTTPRYIPGGRAFQHGLQAARRRKQREILPDNQVAGMPRFAMKDPRFSGLAGAVRFMQRILGAPDPVCVQVGYYITMSDKELAAHFVSRADLLNTAASVAHHCEIRKSSWLDPAGPATHLGSDLN